MQAAQAGLGDLVEVLIEGGADVPATNTKGITALMLAAEQALPPPPGPTTLPTKLPLSHRSPPPALDLYLYPAYSLSLSLSRYLSVCLGARACPDVPSGTLACSAQHDRFER